MEIGGVGIRSVFRGALKETNDGEKKQTWLVERIYAC